MTVIEQFIARYRKEYDFYDQAAKLASQMVEQDLRRAGIRAIVTYRAKSVSRLHEKVQQRHQDRKYKTVDEIFRDIADLAGIRVALYFPGEREEVGKIITGLFVVEGEPKQFPKESRKASDGKRFSGYWATHYRVHLQEESLGDVQKRYTQAAIEVQVASVLMHAWAEVEHDLVYKPLQGKLSDDEYAILDQINGLVMSGEIALEQLQRAANQRVAQHGRQFSNHYDLANFLLLEAKPFLTSTDADGQLGNINHLFKLLSTLEKTTPEELRPYLTDLNTDFERRPLADQVIDRVLEADPKNYAVYEKIREKGTLDKIVGVTDHRKRRQRDTQEAIGRFINQWIELERQLRERTKDQGLKSWLVPTSKVLAEFGQLEPFWIPEFERIRRFRNNVVHGVSAPSAEEINEATQIVASLLQRLSAMSKPGEDDNA
jgi:ppGpp synthetase/RelA/SpoT-type nucleotidyltranferase